ncbi:hypothetical protein F4811DRAFT_309267 [Daldinia bambusicola]|nr:hypothetical protein F4811DRAFT_309267 [Daldinia bambusicola]
MPGCAGVFLLLCCTSKDGESCPENTIHFPVGYFLVPLCLACPKMRVVRVRPVSTQKYLSLLYLHLISQPITLLFSMFMIVVMMIV